MMLAIYSVCHFMSFSVGVVVICVVAFVLERKIVNCRLVGGALRSVFQITFCKRKIS